VDIEKDLNQEQRIQRAHDLCISGFMADSIYNFGELVRSFCSPVKHKNLYDARICQIMHPILGALQHTPHEWLRNMLLAFNEGSIGKFDALRPLFPKEVGRFYSFNTRRATDRIFIAYDSPSCSRAMNSCVRRYA
jgi:26S proteasome regulatory subunit N9